MDVVIIFVFVVVVEIVVILELVRGVSMKKMRIRNSINHFTTIGEIPAVVAH